MSVNEAPTEDSVGQTGVRSAPLSVTESQSPKAGHRKPKAGGKGGKGTQPFCATAP